MRRDSAFPQLNLRWEEGKAQPYSWLSCGHVYLIIHLCTELARVHPPRRLPSSTSSASVINWKLSNFHVQKIGFIISQFGPVLKSYCTYLCKQGNTIGPAHPPIRCEVHSIKAVILGALFNCIDHIQFVKTDSCEPLVPAKAGVVSLEPLFCEGVKSGIDDSPITTAHEAQSDWILLALRLLKPPVHCGSNRSNQQPMQKLRRTRKLKGLFCWFDSIVMPKKLKFYNKIVCSFKSTFLEARYFM